MNLLFLVAAVADVTAVVVHGYIGHRLIIGRLTRERLFSTRAFGDAEMSRRVLVVTWHAVTAAFASSAVMMFLLAFGLVTSRSTPLFVAAMHVSFLLVGLVVNAPRMRGLVLRPIPVGFITIMTTVALTASLGTV